MKETNFIVTLFCDIEYYRIALYYSSISQHICWFVSDPGAGSSFIPLARFNFTCINCCKSFLML